AVISAPASFDEQQRAHLECAARLAGIDVVALIEEPVSAALAHGLGRPEGELLAIYDLGGSAFDCSVMEIRAKRCRVLASGGNSWLGGDDFDLAMAEHSAELFNIQYDVDLDEHPQQWHRLLRICEGMKRQLSDEPVASMELIDFLREDDELLPLEITFDRGIMGELTRELLERTVAELEDVLRIAGVDADELSRIVLTGGQSQSPVVQDFLRKAFGPRCELAPDPEFATVFGNAIYARFRSLELNPTTGATRAARCTAGCAAEDRL
ncbi:MAG: Hsp70 family protein, partial [Deltaproteobacteria bacterium]|nr:Hsp70 family protein [Deltaproteobacteria bacterium]